MRPPRWPDSIASGGLASRTPPTGRASGGRVGSDVPFFFDSPAAWCTGRGEQVTPVKLGRPLDLVLFCPAFGSAPGGLPKSDFARQPLAGG